MGSSSRKGDRRERELVNYLHENGWAVMRAPASGSATERELPDVLAGNGERFYAIEVKASGGDPIYLDREEVLDLQFFASSFGAEARIAARWDEKRGDPSYGESWPGCYFHTPETLHKTNAAGAYRVKKADSIEAGTPVNAL